MSIGWRTTWDDMTARSYNAVADIGSSVGDTLKSAIENPMEAVKDAIGGGLDAMGPFGVGLAAIGGAAAVAGGQLFDLASDAAEAGTQVQVFMQITGTAPEKIGAIGAAAEIADSSLEGLQQMLTMMTRRLEATGPAAEKFDEALGHLGINAKAFRAADPSDRVDMLSDGMQRAAGSTTMMNDALAIMGRAGVQNIHFLMENTEETRKRAAELAYQWSDRSVAAADEFGDSVVELGVGLKTVATTVGVELLPVMTSLVDGTVRFGQAVINVTGLPGYVAMFKLLTGAMGETELAEQTLGAQMDMANRLFADAKKEGLDAAEAAREVATRMLELGQREDVVATLTGMTTAAIKLLKMEMKETATATDAYTEAWEKIKELEIAAYIDDISASDQKEIAREKELGASVETLAAAWGKLPSTIEAVLKAQEKATEAAKKWKEAVEEVEAAGEGWRGTLDTIDGGVVESMRNLTAAGVSLQALSTYYGLNVTQGAAFTKMLKEEEEALKANEKIQGALEKATAEYYKAVTAMSDDTVKKLIDNAMHDADIEIAQMKRKRDYSLEAEEMIREAARLTAALITKNALDAVGNSKAHYDKIAATARAHADFLMANATEVSAAEVNAARLAADAAEIAAQTWTTEFIEAGAESADAVKGFGGVAQETFNQVGRAAEVGAQKVKMTWAEAMEAVRRGEGTMGGTVYQGQLDTRAEIQRAWDEHRYQGPVNPTGTGPDWERIGIASRAAGGPVEAGRPYGGGETRPELFVPQPSGSIEPSVGMGDIKVDVQVSGVWDPSTVGQMADAIGMELMRRTGRKFGSA